MLSSNSSSKMFAFFNSMLLSSAILTILVTFACTSRIASSDPILPHALMNPQITSIHEVHSQVFHTERSSARSRHHSEREICPHGIPMIWSNDFGPRFGRAFARTSEQGALNVSGKNALGAHVGMKRKSFLGVGISPPRSVPQNYTNPKR